MRKPPVKALELSPALQPGGSSFNLLTFPPPSTTSVGSSAAINRATTLATCCRHFLLPAMQALGSYRNGKMLFLGLGTGLGSTLIADGILEPMELGHLPYKKGTYEDYVGTRGLRQFGKKKWRLHVADVVARLIAALEPTDVVLGGGNVSKLKELPPGCRAGDNANAFTGGFRMWEPQRLARHRYRQIRAGS